MACVKGLKDANTRHVLFLISAAWCGASTLIRGHGLYFAAVSTRLSFYVVEEGRLASIPHPGGPGYLPVFVRHFAQRVSGTDGSTRN